MARSNKDQWQQLEQTIHAWLKERQELIVLYCSLSGVNALAESPHEEKVLDKLGRFCQVLVDYLSAGHFEIFAKILEEAEIQHEESSAAIQAYPAIEASTPLLLDFNDTYDASKYHLDALAKLPDALSSIGEVLIGRFDLEDKLISLHQAVR